MIRFGGKEPVDIVIGGKVVSSISMNGDVVWTKGPTGPNYFYIENSNFYSTNCTITMNKVGSTSTGSDLSYSTDGVNFDLCTFTDGKFSIKLFNYGDKVYFRSSTGFSKDQNNYYNFSATGEHTVGGDITTLSNYTNNSLTYIAVPYLFYGDTSLTSAANLDCSKVTAVHDMGGTTPPYEASFKSAFEGCVSLTAAPEFPNLVSVRNSGFNRTFAGCTSLSVSPNLSNITTVSQNTQTSFNSNGGMKEMFYGCSSLLTVYAPNVSSWGDSSGFENWLNSVGQNGTLYKSASLTIPDSVSGCPTTAYGWTYSSL